MTPEEYLPLDATALARLVRDGDVSPLELTDTAISVIEARNPSLNAVIAERFEQAREEARAPLPDGPFRGVPFLVKDLNTRVAGLPATNGARAFADVVPDGDCELVRRHRAAGLVLLGKTNTPEMGLNVTTEPALFGSARNPVNPSRSTGGSSGGSAAAVASGMVPMAHATDSGGSIRIPASCCGLFGLKPSRARVPLGNDMTEGNAGFSTVHAVTRSVRDSASLLALTAGALPGAPYAAPAMNLASGELPRLTRRLRVALWTEGFNGEFVHSDCAAGAELAAATCESLGHSIEHARPAFDAAAFAGACDVLFTASVATALAPFLDRHGAGEFEPATLDCARRGRERSAIDFARAIGVLHDTAARLGTFFEDHDVLLTPTLANPPLPLGTLDMATPDWDRYWSAVTAEIPFTVLFNGTGAPGASIPLAQSADGLPVGVHFGAPLGLETRLLALAAELEAATPWDVTGADDSPSGSAIADHP